MPKSKEEIKAYIKKAQAPHIIPFIHNYCDRSCEKCAFVNRCNVGIRHLEFEKKMAGVDDEAELMQEVMNEVKENLDMTMEMLKMDAEEGFIDPSVFEPDKERDRVYELFRKRQNEFVDNNEVKKLAHEYGSKVHDWMKNEKEIFKLKGEELESHLLMGISDEKNAWNLVNEMKDAVETIQWFQHFIEVKFSRALSGLFDVMEGEEEEDEIQTDYNGSAKIAMIAVDRSLAAWETMMEIFSDKRDDIIVIAALLSRLKSEAVKQFPDAMKFVRPGFD
ncbi:MAG: hypothetical protein ACHQD9_00510 [Chitinophagales bacterium]